MGHWLSERLGQQFVIENRPGASTTIGTEVVVRASPDGYTLLLITTSSAINTTLFKLNYNFLRDIVPIAGIFRAPNVMVVHPSVPAKTVPDFIASAKLNQEINAGLADPKLRAQLADLGGMVLAGSSTDFEKLITEETEKWGKVIRAANIKAE